MRFRRFCSGFAASPLQFGTSLCRLLLTSLMLPGVAALATLTPAAQAEDYYAAPDFNRLAGDGHLKLIDLKAFQQTTTYTCGPASAVSLMKFYGMRGDELTLAKEMRSTQALGTNIINLTNGLKAHGFNATWGQNGTLQLLRDNLAKGIPTIVGWMDWGGHYVICVGYDDRGTDNVYDDVIVFADPADFYDGDRDGLTWFNAKRFESMWIVKGDTAAMPWVKGLYVVARPKG